jgi:adenosine deaminase
MTDTAAKGRERGPVTRWLAGLPKTELHLHIDGSLRAPRLLELAAKHGVELPYATSPRSRPRTISATCRVFSTSTISARPCCAMKMISTT